MHDLRAGLRVLQLGDINIFGAHAGLFERRLGCDLGCRPAALVVDRSGKHLERSGWPGAHHRGLQPDDRHAQLPGLFLAGEDQRHRAFRRRAEHIFGQRITDHRRVHDRLQIDLAAPPGVIGLDAVAERLFGDPAECFPADIMFVQIAHNLGAEKLHGQHIAGFAIPVGQAVGGRIGVEGTARMLVEADRHAHFIFTRLDRADRGVERRPAGRAAVRDIDELDAGQAELRHHIVGIARCCRAAKGKFDILPFDAAVGERLLHGEYALVHAIASFGASERVNPCSYDTNI